MSNYVCFLQIGKNPMQSPGAYALVNAMKNNPESTLVEIELTVRSRNVLKIYVRYCKAEGQDSWLLLFPLFID